MKRRVNLRGIPVLGFALLGVVALTAGPSTEGTPGSEPAAPPAVEDGAGRLEDAATVADPSTTAPRQGAASVGMRVYLDPETGELRSGPPAPLAEGEERGRLSPAERLNFYGGDLLQEPLEEGGFKVDLRGRFQTSVVATIDPETDEVSIDCVQAPAGSHGAEKRRADDER